MTSDMTTVLQCWAKFSNDLVRSCIRMICAKNYATASKRVKVMTRILWPLFFADTVYNSPDTSLIRANIISNSGNSQG